MTEQDLEHWRKLDALQSEVDAAYREARKHVFDIEGPHADPAQRTLPQRRMVNRLENLEARMRALRRQVERERADGSDQPDGDA